MTRLYRYVCTALVCTAAVALGACDPLDACDSNQYYRKGSCRVCPDDAVSTGEWCTCNDPDKEFRNDACQYPEGQEPEPDAAVDHDDDGGTEADAASGGAGEACTSYCGFLRTCVADNELAAELAQDVIDEAGIAGADTSGCEAACGPDGAEPANGAALDCFVTMADGASCAGDDTFDGVDEALSIIDGCCTAHAASDVCTRLCAAIAINDTALGLVPACQ